MIYKQRASGAGTLLSNPRAKKDYGTLSLTSKTMVQDWYKERLYGKRKNIYSKYMDKGTTVEAGSLEWLVDELDLGIGVKKNEEQFDNGIFTGMPDIKLPDLIIDIKNSWDFSTFPLFATEPPDKKNEVQVQVYMHLTGCDNAKVCYLLSNTPKHLVEKEIYWATKDLGDAETQEVASDIWEYHTYNDLKEELRLKVFDYAYDPEMIANLTERVGWANEYLNTIKLK